MKIILVVLILMIASCSIEKTPTSQKIKEINESKENLNVATFAGGCFWCTESDFEKHTGVVHAISGYTGGEIENPTYQQVSSGKTNHIESVQIYYNSKIITYEKLLEIYFKHIDPTDNNGQFVDRGNQYKPVIFYHNQNQKQLAENAIKKIEEAKIFNTTIKVELQKNQTFYPAEDYHQDYHKKNPLRYKYYRGGSGRDEFIKENWDKSNFTLLTKQKNYTKMTKEELKQKLTPIQYHVTQEDGTEKPFENEYWNNTKDGIYVDIISGEPLFSSTDKFKSGTGWPSFTKPLATENIIEKKDYKLLIPRIEIRSKHADSHIGHVFNDGPKENGGLRYCMNSAALKFIPKEDLNKEGYNEYIYLFE